MTRHIDLDTTDETLRPYVELYEREHDEVLRLKAEIATARDLQVIGELQREVKETRKEIAIQIAKRQFAERELGTVLDKYNKLVGRGHFKECECDAASVADHMGFCPARCA